MMRRAEIIAQRRVQNWFVVWWSSQTAIAQRRAIEAYDRMPPNQIAHPIFVPHHGSSRSVQMSPPSASAKRNPKKVVGSIWRRNLVVSIKRHGCHYDTLAIVYKNPSLSTKKSPLQEIILWDTILLGRGFVRLARYTSCSGDSYRSLWSWPFVP